MPPETPDLRVSDRDREQAAGALSAHYAAGRLGDHELDQRLTAVYHARTESELGAPLADLPAIAPGELELRREFNARRRDLQRRMLQQSGGGLVPFAVCSAIWVASGATGAFWPAFVLLAVLVPLLKNGWALYGPAPDLDRVEARLDSETRHRAHHADRQARRAERQARRAERSRQAANR